MRVCAQPGCPILTTESYCPQHRRSIDKAIKERTAEQRKVYTTRRWKALRRRVLREQPWCAVCGMRPATDVDHIIPLREGGPPFDRVNVQGLCKADHSAKTGREVRR